MGQSLSLVGTRAEGESEKGKEAAESKNQPTNSNMKAGQFKKRYIYRGRRIQFNDVNRLWWFRIVNEDGKLEERCANTLGKAKDKIDKGTN